MNELTHTLTDIVRSGSLLDSLKAPAGPNNWDEVGAGDFGIEHDFEIENHGSLFVFNPVCEAALQWCYRFLPEDCPRWGIGFVIEPHNIEAIVTAASKHLMSESNYSNAMEELNQLDTQWEGQ